ncbi:NB-ARC domain-containing protein [Streptomyces angustmyceticus]
MDGGRGAARGFQYQYHRTLEHLVAVIDESDVACVRVEGPPSGGGLVDKVDFDVVTTDGAVHAAVQVKSRAAGGSMSGALALGILLDMLNGSQIADSYLLLTNARPGVRGERLADILTGGLDSDVLRDTLTELFRDAPQRLDQLQRLDSDGLSRLTRCRLEFDPRDDDEIREELRNALRGVRNRAHQGLGDKSAGLLSGYLISEILDRAADVSGERAAFSTADLRSLVLVDAQTLAQSVGARDWGTIAGKIPAIPDVRRPKLIDPLLAAFPAAGARQTRRTTLVGPSGIGKSSTAALYIAERADAYDFLGWIDCETTASTHLSFQRVLDEVDPGRAPGQAGPEETQQAVHRALGRLPGRWLLIFDNVATIRQAEPWVPQAGRGDVIITTLNAATHLGTGEVVQVPTMERDESVQLLTRRLQLSPSDESLWQHALDRLASELGDWPLALELGASYLYTCGLGVDEVDHYLNTLKIRSFTDEEMVPPGYPRTLAAAHSMCIEQIEARIHPGADLDPAAVGLQMFYAAAYLASQQIPAHLLLVAAITRVEDFDEEHRGAVLVPPQVVNIGEALRELSRFSLIKSDLPLPPTYGEKLPGADRSLSINTVSQEMMRDRLSRHPQQAAAINQLAGHVERWLTGPAQLGELERVRVMQSHAETLLAHIDRLDLPSECAALILGNLAGPYYVQGDALRAEELFLRELDYLVRSGSNNDALVVQTRFALATMTLQIQDRANGRQPVLKTTLDDAVDYLEFVLQQARAWMFDYPKAAMKLAVDSRLLISGSHFAGDIARRLALLADAFADLESRIEPTSYAANYAVLERAEGCLQNRRYTEAEELCRGLLDQGVSGSLEAETRRRLIEALAGQAKWDEAISEVTFWQADPAAPRLFRQAIVDLIRNVCVSCAEAFSGGDPGSLRLMNHVLDWPDLDEFLAMGSDDDNHAITSARSLREVIRKASGR